MQLQYLFLIHTHAVVAANAIKRGIHVYVQKPLTHNVYEARLLTKIAREYKVVTQMGNQGASNPDQLKIQEWINQKKIGNISKVDVWTDRPIWPSVTLCQKQINLSNQKA